MYAQKPVDDTHKIDFAALTEKATEKGFNLRVFGEVDKVVDINPERQWGVRPSSGGVRRVDDVSRVETRILEGRGEANRA
jgi:hypothetical protein